MSDPHETLARIRAQAAAATEGPWRHVSIFEEGGFVEDDDGRDIFRWIEDDAGTICATDPDAEFIAASRTTVPALVDALEAVLKVHRPDHVESRDLCASCFGWDSEPVLWPCPTVKAITDALDTNH